MTISKNKELIQVIKDQIVERAPVPLGVNKKNELVRLVYEICRRDGTSPSVMLDSVGILAPKKEMRGDFFRMAKKRLMHQRYPSFKIGCDPHLLPMKINGDGASRKTWNFELDPKTVFVENSIRDLEWTKKFLSFFPRSEVREISTFSEGARTISKVNPVEKYNRRAENVFLIRNKDAFVKVCPCTKGYKKCGYWILNVGFGCPIDCSYCFLQLYSNAPGLILPANIDEFYDHVKRFDNKVVRKTRIGTGEFTDSLALDRYTGYSAKLISLFRGMKNLVLELKTKVAEIDNILKEEPHENVVISWSVNDRDIASKYEEGGATMDERIDAAKRAAQKGYKIGFHFDPMLYSQDWEEGYKAIVEEIFSIDVVRENTVWISLGTLRYTPGMKQVAEQRFSNNGLYYDGEFFAGSDGKLRYPRKLRIDMYSKMVNWIRNFDTSCWIYLCMEPEEVWTETPLKESARTWPGYVK
jgi:DNA repair photolyase